VYIHTCVYTYMCVCLCVCVSAHEHTHTHTHTHTHAHTHTKAFSMPSSLRSGMWGGGDQSKDGGAEAASNELLGQAPVCEVVLMCC